MAEPKTEPSPLDTLRRSPAAWARFKRLMLFMVVLTLAVVGIALGLFYREFGLISIHFYIATGLGVFFAMMLTAGLMGLAFLSNASGHDAAMGAAQDPHNADQEGGGESR
jgi:fatty-acid desaturase